MKINLVVTLAAGLVGLIFYALGAAYWRKRIFRASLSAGSPSHNSYEIFSRGSKTIAMRSSSRRQYLAGAFYTLTFFIGLPIYIWQYGLHRAVGLIGIPTLISLPCILMIDLGDPILSATIVTTPIRAATGLWLASKHPTYVKKSYIRRGWSPSGTFEAKSSRAAKQVFERTV